MALEHHNRSERAAVPAVYPPAARGPRTHTAVATTGDPLSGRRYCWAHACRDSEVVCGRVQLTIDTDPRLGLTARERRSLIVRFLDGLESGLHAELTELVSRRGASARRAAERMDPIEIVYDDPLRGLQRITGSVQPPQRRNGDLPHIQFGLREPTP